RRPANPAPPRYAERGLGTGRNPVLLPDQPNKPAFSPKPRGRSAQKTNRFWPADLAGVTLTALAEPIHCWKRFGRYSPALAALALLAGGRSCKALPQLLQRLLGLALRRERHLSGGNKLLVGRRGYIPFSSLR